MDNALLHTSGHSPAEKVEGWLTFALIHARLYLAESDDDETTSLPLQTHPIQPVVP